MQAAPRVPANFAHSGLCLDRRDAGLERDDRRKFPCETFSPDIICKGAVTSIRGRPSRHDFDVFVDLGSGELRGARHRQARVPRVRIVAVDFAPDESAADRRSARPRSCDSARPAARSRGTGSSCSCGGTRQTRRSARRACPECGCSGLFFSQLPWTSPICISGAYIMSGHGIDLAVRHDVDQVRGHAALRQARVQFLRARRQHLVAHDAHERNERIERIGRWRRTCPSA